MSDIKPENGFKRKKKRSFQQQQKRFCKQGRLGHGAKIDQDTYEYFLRLMGVINTTKNDVEEMNILAGSVFKESEGQEVIHSSNQLSSRVIEELLPFTSDVQFEAFITALTENLRPIFSDPYSSHVLQKAVVEAYVRYSKLAHDLDNKTRTYYLSFIIKIAKFSLNNLDDFVFDTYGNHIIRTVVNILDGKVEEKSNQKSQIDVKSTPTPEEFKSILDQYAVKILNWPQLHDLLSQDLTSAFVQTLLTATKNNQQINKKMVKAILKICKAEFFNLNENQPFVRLLEVTLTVAPLKYFKKLHKRLFQGHLMEYSLSSSCNFLVQKLLLYAPEKELYESCFDEIKDGIKEILKSRYTGVLQAMAQACHKHKARQGQFIISLMRALDCHEPEEKTLLFTPLVCCLLPYEEYDPSTSKVNLHGSVIVQEMLHFNKPIKIINSLFHMSVPELVKLFSDPRGCHVTQAFVQSTFVGEKSREKLFKKLQGQYVNLVTSKHGSRSVEDIWNALHLNQKVIIMDELKSNMTDLNASSFGKGFAFKYHLDSFRRDKEIWMKQMSSSSSAEKLFADIIPKSKKKKPNKS